MEQTDNQRDDSDPGESADDGVKIHTISLHGRWPTLDTAGMLREAMRPAQELMAAQRRSLAASLAATAPATSWQTALDPVSRYLRQERERSKITNEVFARRWQTQLADTLKPLHDLFKSLDVVETFGFPPNWQDWPSRPRAKVIEELAKAGYPVCWVPRAEVILSVYDAPAGQRSHVLAAHSAEILKDCDTVIKEITAADLQELSEAAAEAVCCLRQGQIKGGQALASNIVDTALRRAIPHQHSVYKAAIEHAEATASPKVIELRRAATFWPVVTVLQAFWPSKGDPVPDSYNRHASAHAVGKTQYTLPNALLAVMLATSMLRELHQQTLEEPRPGHPVRT